MPASERESADSSSPPSLALVLLLASLQTASHSLSARIQPLLSFRACSSNTNCSIQRALFFSSGSARGECSGSERRRVEPAGTPAHSLSRARPDTLTQLADELCCYVLCCRATVLCAVLPSSDCRPCESIFKSEREEGREQIARPRLASAASPCPACPAHSHSLTLACALVGPSYRPNQPTALEFTRSHSTAQSLRLPLALFLSRPQHERSRSSAQQEERRCSWH